MSNQVPTVTPRRAKEITVCNAAAVLLDVRTPSEFSNRRAVGTRNIPLNILGAFVSWLPKDVPILLLCEKEKQASAAATRLRGEGFDFAQVIEDGMEAWAASGLPVEGSAGKVISIEQQTRIGAGCFLLLGVILGFLLSPIFFALPAFVGTALIFSEITDWTGIGLLLARAPWNR